jgi:hypothetical protein
MTVIKTASEHGRVEVVKLLLQDSRVDPSAGHNYSIKAAAEFGYVKVVRELLKSPKVDPTVENNYPIRKAAGNFFQ